MTTSAPQIIMPKLGRSEAKVGTVKDKVYLRLTTPARQVALELEWQAALDLGNALWHMSRHVEQAIKQGVAGGVFDARTIGRRTTVMARGQVLIVNHGGMDVFNAEWPVARAVGGHLIHHAHRAESFVKAHLIIDDQALLIRTGVNIGLTTLPGMDEEAAKEAVHNTALRRYVPIPHYGEQVGHPAVRKPRLHRRKEQGSVR